jgi:hypothetical protein
MSTFLNESITANGDYRVFIGSGPFDLETGESIRVGFAYCAGVGLTGIQGAATEALFNWNNYVVPVELTSFTGSNIDGNIILRWSTATEINNKIFQIERRKENSNFVTIGFVEGKGTTTEQQEYSYVDRNVTTGKYFYRLKQIDFDGTFEYSNEIEVDVSLPKTFSLGNCYPNPFNPSTKIIYEIPKQSTVILKVYDILGNEVSTLVNEMKSAGSYQIVFDASELSNGVYFYRLQADNFIETKKMILMK